MTSITDSLLNATFQQWVIVFLYRYVNLYWEKQIAKRLIKDTIYLGLRELNNDKLIHNYIGSKSNLQFICKVIQYYV